MLCPSCRIESLRRVEGDLLVYRCRNRRCRMHGEVLSATKIPEAPTELTEETNEVTEKEA